MTIDVSRLRHLGAPPPPDSSAPPGTPRVRCLFRPRWLLIASLIALSLTVSASSLFQTLNASAAPADSVVADTTGETPGQIEVASDPDAQDTDAAVDGGTGDASASEGTVSGRYTTTSRGGTRPAASPGSQIASVSRQYEGAPYRWAGASPAGFDCSGFSMYVYSKVGISIPRDLWGQLNTGTRLGMDELQPGDIVFFQNTYARGLSHSGIYLGDDQFIHAETEWTGVVISRLRGSQWGRDFVAGSRPYER